MISEPLKRGVLARLSIVFLLGILFALNNWIGSGPAIKQLKESVDSVDAAQVQNESLNLAAIAVAPAASTVAVISDWTASKTYSSPACRSRSISTACTAIDRPTYPFAAIPAHVGADEFSTIRVILPLFENINKMHSFNASK
jgi:hypothetical protein